MKKHLFTSALILLTAILVVPPAVSGREALLLSDFNDVAGWKKEVYRRSVVNPTSISDPQYLKDQNYAARVEYDFTDTDFGTVGFGLFCPQTLPLIDELPKKVGLWVYGDGWKHWLRGRYYDGKGVLKQCNFTEEFRGVDWVGWKYVAVDIPADTPLPIRWHSIRLLEVNEDRKNAGVIYFSTFRAAFTDEDMTGPAIDGLTPAWGARAYTSFPEINARIKDDMSGVDAASIILTVDGQAVPHTYDPATGMLRYVPSTPLNDGEHWAKLQVKDLNGNWALPEAEWHFIVYTGPDVEPPVVWEIMPAAGSPVIRTGLPRISLRIRDEYTGVAYGEIELLLDGRLTRPLYDEQTGILFYSPEAPLANGVHYLSLRARDRSGNAIAPLDWTITIDDFQPRDPRHFYFAGLADGHDHKVFAEHIRKVNKGPAEFVLFDGDVMENDTLAQYQDAAGCFAGLEIPWLQSIGNHEISGTMSRTHYQQFFGPTIYTKDIGETRFIVLDSATGQSLSIYDPSQREYLRLMLEQNEKRHVFVVVHVPTTYSDPLSAMYPEDGLYVEALLAEYKRNNPEKNVWALFGHLHGGRAWQKDGVNYYVIQTSGSSASTYNYSLFEVNGKEINEQRVFFPATENPVAPMASITYHPALPCPGESIAFDASGSRDPDGVICSYAWDLDNDTQYDDATGMVLNHCFGTAGDYPVGLQVTDDDESRATACVVVTVDGRAAAPRLSPGGRTYSFPPRVTMDCPTVGAVIRYTIDGSEPTMESPAYDGPLTVTADAVVKAAAFKDGLRPSETTSAVYVIRGRTVIFRPGGGDYSTTKTARNYRYDPYIAWDGGTLQLGKGRNGKIADAWLYFPDLIGGNEGQIPADAQIGGAKLVLTSKKFTGDADRPHRIKLYRLTDPDGLGAPYFGTEDGNRTGLDFQYRDHRPGMDVPWADGAADVLAMLRGQEPQDTFEYIPAIYAEQGYTAIELDVTEAVRSWAAGVPNHGWLITLDGEWLPGESLMLEGVDTAEWKGRPYLQVSYLPAGGELTPPAAVKGLAATPGSGRNTLDWINPPLDFAGVTIVRKVGAVPFDPYDGLLVYDGAGEAYTDTGLDDGVPYYYGIFAYNAEGNYSAKAWIKAIPGTPYEPTLAAVPGQGHVLLSWTGVRGASSYRLYRYDGAETRVITVAEGTACTDWNVEKREYTYSVAGINAAGEGQLSMARMVTPLADTIMPEAPIILQVTTTNTTVTLAWTDVACETGYVIERVAGEEVVAVTVGFDVTTFTDADLAPNTRYLYRVKAVRGDRSSGWCETGEVVTRHDSYAPGAGQSEAEGSN